MATDLCPVLDFSPCHVRRACTRAMMVINALALGVLHAGPGDSPVHQVGQGQGPRVPARVSR